MSESGNIAQIVRAFGKLIILAISPLAIYQARGTEIAVNTYDAATGINGFHEIKTIFIDLDRKAITNEFSISNDGEIINMVPIQYVSFQDTLLITAITRDCYCKNTSVGENNSTIIIINKTQKSLTRRLELSHTMITDFVEINSSQFYISGAKSENDQNIDLDGRYNLDNEFSVSRIQQENEDYYPNTINGIAQDNYAFRINDNVFYTIDDGKYYLMRTDGSNRVLSSLSLESIVSRNCIFGSRDSMIYVFSLNYELHENGEIQNGNRQNWVTPNVRLYNQSDFSLLDSIVIHNYGEGESISGSRGIAKLIGPYMYFYFGESDDMNILYPAMLFIFDTRTNEATWLRVGWR
jgi:hypothetical protein